MNVSLKINFSFLFKVELIVLASFKYKKSGILNVILEDINKSKITKKFGGIDKFVSVLKIINENTFKLLI